MTCVARLSNGDPKLGFVLLWSQIYWEIERERNGGDLSSGGEAECECGCQWKCEAEGGAWW